MGLLRTTFHLDLSCSGELTTGGGREACAGNGRAGGAGLGER